MIRRCGAALAGAVVLAAAVTARGHTPPRMATRELVRIQGYRTKTAGAGVQRRLVLTALGVEQSFAATDFQVFGFSDAPPPGAATPSATPTTPEHFVLQGSREVLTRFAAARPQQTVTLLAEHRPGSTNLFVLTLDLCPPR
jgi:hypothetical protein